MLVSNCGEVVVREPIQLQLLGRLERWEKAMRSIELLNAGNQRSGCEKLLDTVVGSNILVVAETLFQTPKTLARLPHQDFLYNRDVF